MSGNQGISLIIPGGVNDDTVMFDVGAFTSQFRQSLLDYGVSWVIINLSNHKYGDTYLAPHPYLTFEHIGSTPKVIPSNIWKNDNDDVFGDDNMFIYLENYRDRDLFREFLDALDSMNVKVFAYMSAQGPAMLTSTETKAYDYNNIYPFVDSCSLCPVLTSQPYPFCGCAPSVHFWRRHVRNSYGGRDDEVIMKVAYAEIIVDEYAKRYKDKLAGFYFDQGDVADMVLIVECIRDHIPKAMISFGTENKSIRLHYPFDDFTFGTPVDSTIPSSDCSNYYPFITTTEVASQDGYFDTTLAHIHAPLNSEWDSGSIVWHPRQAHEWQSRMIAARGAWTWGVKRASIDGNMATLSYMDPEDVLFVQIVNEAMKKTPDYKYLCEESPTVSPTVSASQPVSLAVSDEDVLGADFGATIYMHGNMFDIEAMKDMLIHGLDVMASINTVFSIKVYTRTGTYKRHETNIFGWDLILDEVDIWSKGGNKATPLPDFSDPIEMLAGTTRAFYVTSSEPVLLCSMGMQEGEIATSNSNLRLYVGTLNLDEFGIYAKDYTWNGNIRFEATQEITLIPTVSLKPSIPPTTVPTISIQPSKKPSQLPTRSSRPTFNPTLPPTISSKPTVSGSSNPSISTHPSPIASVKPTISSHPSKKPSSTPSISSRPTAPTDPSSSPTRSSAPTTIAGNAEWMAGNHGISIRITGGTNYGTVLYDVDAFVLELEDKLLSYGVKWVIVTLSTSYYGDRYLGQHSFLTTNLPGSTPKEYDNGWDGSITDLSTLPDRDIFGEFVDRLDGINVKVIAYMAAQGPALLISGETKAYDYMDNSPYVDSFDRCPSLTGTPAPFGACAPSVHLWKAHVAERYFGSKSDATLRKAFAAIIVGEYAERYKQKLAGFFFDNGEVADIPAIYEVVQESIPHAAVTFNKGQRLPLTNNNAPYEDYTFGWPHFDFNAYPPPDCKNYPAITSVEDKAQRGYFESSDVPGQYSLGHLYMPLNDDWAKGSIVWQTDKAQEWMSRVLRARGAWTWAVKRATGSALSAIDFEDVQFLRRVYTNLNMPGPYTYNCQNNRFSFR